MSRKIMQVNFKLSVPSDVFEQGCTPEAAQPFAEVAGLQWKIWILNHETGEAGGIKLFQDEVSLRAYMNGPLWTAVKNGTGWTDVQVKIFDILDVPSVVTRAPL